MILCLAAAWARADVLEVFTAKCAPCHGPALVKPRGNFGWITDLKRLAQDPEKLDDIVKLTAAGNMPPNGSATGPLSAAEKETISAWVSAGAPDVSPTPVPETGGEPVTPVQGDVRGAGQRTLAWLGKLHLLVLHFPIVLVLVGAGCEAWRLWQDNPLAGLLAYCSVLLAAPLAVLTAGLGWLYAWSGAGVGQPWTLFAHRTVGTAAAMLVVLTAYLYWVSQQRLWVTVSLMVSALFMVLTAHLGGTLVQGPGFLDW